MPGLCLRVGREHSMTHQEVVGVDGGLTKYSS